MELSQEVKSLMEIDAFDVHKGKGAFFSEKALRNFGWIAIILEGDFNDKSSSLLNACKNRHFHNAVCFNLDANKQDPFIINLEYTDLNNVHNSFHVPSYSILEIKKNFCIVSDSDFYWGLAGPKEFVDSIFGESPIEIIEEFQLGVKPYRENNSAEWKEIGNFLFDLSMICVRSLENLQRSL